MADRSDQQAPRLSVVVPTYQRRDLVLASLTALERQDVEAPFEVVVVVDGSTDGTAAAVRTRSWAMPLRVIEHNNRGLAATRNRGARASAGDVLLFLDDDMEAAPGLLRAHLAAHADGADAAVGAMPLHPRSPRNILSEDVGRWAAQLAARCSQPGYVLEPDDVFGGQLSIRRDLFFSLGGFDERFTVGGEFGNEDVDLSHRLVGGGHRVVFRPDAVSYQRFVVTGGEDLRRWRQVGKADMTLSRSHAELHPSLRAASLRQPPQAALARLVVAAPNLTARLVAPLRWLGVRLADAGVRDPATRRLYAQLHLIHYWLGVTAHGGPHDGTAVRVLCWHALRDLTHDPQLEPYGVPPEVFAGQLATLRRAGYALITPDELLAMLERRAPVPRRAALVTFDDCYAELGDAGAKILTTQEATAIAFAVSARVGDRNRWDDHLGVESLPLADWPTLQHLRDHGVEIGSHSRTHPMLSAASDDVLHVELAGSGDELAIHDLPAPRLLAYPYGDHDARVAAAARAAGYRAAFTVDPGCARPTSDPHRLPRIEIGPQDRGWRLRLKVRCAGRPLWLWLPKQQQRTYVVAVIKDRLRPVRDRLLRAAGRHGP